MTEKEQVTVLVPTRHDFPEDWTPQAVAKGMHTRTCRRCGATIMGAPWRRTCRPCVEKLADDMAASSDLPFG